VRTSWPAVVVGVALLVAGCGTSLPGVVAVQSRDSGREPIIGAPDSVPPPTTDPPPPPSSEFPAPPATSPVPPDITVDYGGDHDPQAWDPLIEAYLNDINRFWNSEFEPLYGSAWEPLDGGIHAASPDRQQPLPAGCGGADYSEVEGNAYYCDEGDFIVFDDYTLVPLLVEQFGDSTLGVVLAHEFGHAVQARTGSLDQPVILAEQQADCFAGAWVAHVARGETDGLSFDDDDIRGGMVAMIAVRDPVFDPTAGANSHGTGFDRVGAFQDGFVGGAQRCVSFFDEDRDLVNIPFDDNDYLTQGNLPFADIVSSLGGDLDRYWSAALADDTDFTAPTIQPFGSADAPRCAGVESDEFEQSAVFCPDTNTILIDDEYARTLYDTALPSVSGDDILLGDMSVGYLLASAYGDAVQWSVGDENPDPLISDCLTGAWVSDIIPPLPTQRRVRLSPGDLDEAVVTAIIRADSDTQQNGRGEAFDKIDAFRTGVLGGLGACTG
jgi:predicted metalloprotease